MIQKSRRQKNHANLRDKKQKKMQPLRTKNHATSWNKTKNTQPLWIKKIKQPLETKKKSCYLLGQKKSLWTTKIMQPLDKKITEPHGTTKITQPLMTKNIMQPLGTTELCIISGQQKITQTLGTKKITQTLRTKRNHATSGDKISHATSRDKKNIMNSIGWRLNPGLLGLVAIELRAMSVQTK